MKPFHLLLFTSLFAVAPAPAEQPHRVPFRPPVEQSTNRFAGLDERLKPVVESLEQALGKWKASTNYYRQQRLILWNQAAMEALGNVAAADAGTILGWAETHHGASQIVDEFYLSPLHQRIALLDPSACRAALLNEGALTPSHASGLEGSSPWRDEMEHFWHAYYRGLSEKDPKDAMNRYEEDVADPKLNGFIDGARLRIAIYSAVAAVDSKRIIGKAENAINGAKSVELFTGFCRGAPVGQNWAALADKELATIDQLVAGKDFDPSDIVRLKAQADRAAATRWLREDPAAALVWNLSRGNVEPSILVKSDNIDPFAPAKETPPKDRNLELILRIAQAETDDPTTEAEAIVSKLIASGASSEIDLATRVLRELVNPWDDPDWLKILATLPDDKARTEIFLDLVHKTLPRTDDDPFAPSVPDDAPSNPAVTFLQSWIPKMHLTSNQETKAKAALKGVETKEGKKHKNR